MALVVVSDRRHANRDKPMVSVNYKLKRLIINKSARELMVSYYKKEFENVLLLRDTERSDAFWLMPCSPDVEGARQLNTGGGYTRTVSCSLLLNELKWKSNKTETYPVVYDRENKAFRVDLDQSQKGEK
jgi:hypothetical protein